MKQSAVDFIYEEILSDIVNLNLEPGAKISENKIGDKYDVSRTIVRSVFRILQEQNFLEVLPKSGTYVTKIDYSYIKATLILRVSVEKELLRRILANKEEKNKMISQLDECYYKQLEYVEEKEKNSQMLIEQDFLFHRAIFSGHGNYDMSKLIENHLYHFARWRNLTVKSGYSLVKIIEEHKNIIDAIKNNDVYNLMRIMDEHLDKTSYGDFILDKKYRVFLK